MGFWKLILPTLFIPKKLQTQTHTTVKLLFFIQGHLCETPSLGQMMILCIVPYFRTLGQPLEIVT